MKMRHCSSVAQICEGRDSNPRTTTGLDPKSNAFDLAGLPSQKAYSLVSVEMKLIA